MQLDIFDHSCDVMLRNDVGAALARRDAFAARSAWHLFKDECPTDERRADIAFADHDAVCDARRVLNDDIEPAARRVFGVQAGASWVATLWQETARRAARLLLRSECSEDHAAPL